MEINKIVITQFDVPLEEPFVTALRPVPKLERVLVEVETNDGLVGVGEAAPGPLVTGETQAGITDILETMIAPVLIGRDPLRTERLVDLLQESVGRAPTAKAAVDIALHDIKAKVADMPLYRLLGGHADDPVLKVPTVLSMKEPEQMATDAAAAVDAGYEQVKIKLGDDPETDIERVQAVVNAVPTDVHLKADANQGWSDAKTALRVLQVCGEHLDLIEQPLVASDIEGLIAVCDQSPIPVMPDESVWDATDVLSLVRRGAGDLYNIKLMKTGGLHEAGRLNAIAAANNSRTQMGSMIEGHVGTAAGAHFVLAHGDVIGNDLVGPFMTTTGITDLEFDEPRIEVSGPGLGVFVDRDILSDLAIDSREVTA
jgi:L-alanine-DL-glutamate epimerase-like enolase superfamily enzyme